MSDTLVTSARDIRNFRRCTKLKLDNSTSELRPGPGNTCGTIHIANSLPLVQSTE